MWECLNCGLTDYPKGGRGLCYRCYRRTEIRRRFDKKPNRIILKWSRKMISTLRWMRTTERVSIPNIATVFGTSSNQIRDALHKYKIFRFPKLKT